MSTGGSWGVVASWHEDGEVVTVIYDGAGTLKEAQDVARALEIDHSGDPTYQSTVAPVVGLPTPTDGGTMEHQERQQDVQGVGAQTGQPPVEGELREEDVTAGDRLDDRVSESEGLPDESGAA